MAEHQIIFESEEHIYGVATRAIDWIHYDCRLTIYSGGKMPVKLEMSIVQPHPFYIKMPHQHLIEARTISALYMKIFRLFKQYKLEYRG